MQPQIFIDTADVEAIRTWNKRGIIDGVTTNQKIFSAQLEKYGIVDVKKTVIAICKEVSGSVSVELTTHESVKDMMSEAIEYASWHHNVAVKVPMTPDGLGLDVVRELTRLKIKTNMTIMMTAAQLILAAKAGATYVSLFYNRAKDAGLDPKREISLAKKYIQEANLTSRIIAGSIRKPEDVSEIVEANADIITIPDKILDEMLKHEMTDKTIIEFDESWKAFMATLESAKAKAPTSTKKPYIQSK